MPVLRGFNITSTALRLAACLFLILGLLPQPVSAAPSAAVVLNFNVIAVKKDTSVTIRTKDFPVRTKFTITIDVVKTTVGSQPAGKAIEAGQLDSANGGEVEATFPIPESLRGKLILNIRIESKDGYTATNWFFNEDMAAPQVVTSAGTKAVVKPEISFSDIKKGASVTLEAKNLPAKTIFWVRIGPYYTFYRDYISLKSVQSADDGTLKTTLEVPEKVRPADYLMVRLDGGGTYVYNIYQNVDNGKVVQEKTLYKFSWCKVLYSQPVGSLAPGEEFDVVWALQNTSNTDWKASKIAYKYLSGEELYKYKNFYPLSYAIKNGWNFEVAVDMIAPKELGWHTTQWAIYDPRSDTVMCTMKMSIFVTDAKK